MDRETLPLWKLVVGVALGVLVADLVRMAWMALTVSALLGAWGVSTKNPGKITNRTPSAAAVARPSIPDYHGPNGAYRAGSSRACVDGVMANQAGLAWEVDRSQGAPIRCRATTN